MKHLTRKLDMIEENILNSWKTNNDHPIAKTYNYTFLICATIGAELGLVDAYLKVAPVDIDAVETLSKRSALMHAAIHGDVDIAKLLIEHGANTTLIDDYGYNALYLALGQRYDREKANLIDEMSQYTELAKLFINIDEESDIAFGDNDTTNPEKLKYVRQALLELKAEVKAEKMAKLLHDLRRYDNSSVFFQTPRDVVDMIKSYVNAPRHQS